MSWGWYVNLSLFVHQICISPLSQTQRGSKSNSFNDGQLFMTDAISEEEKQQFRLKWKAQPQHNPPLQVSGNWMNFPYKRCFDASLLSSNYGSLPALCVPVQPLVICYEHTALTYHQYFFFWPNKPSTFKQILYIKKGKKERRLQREGLIFSAKWLTLARKRFLG